jgi:hypothetical protein
MEEAERDVKEAEEHEKRTKQNLCESCPIPPKKSF